MQRNLKKNGLVNLAVLLLAGGAGFAIARFSQSMTGQVAALFLGLGGLAALVSWFQMRLEDREQLELLELDEMRRGAGSGALFDSAEAELQPARKAREQFERLFVPGFTVVLMLLEGAGAYWLWRWLSQQRLVAGAAPVLNQPLVAMAVLGLLALFLFVFGKYAAGVARLEGERLLRAGASWLLLGAYLLALAIGGIIAFEAGFPRVDYHLARLLCVLLGLLAVESLVTLILEVYRPRIKGKAERLLYESRLVGLLSRPEGLFTTVAQTLDYQFGFKVSETWFYQFLQDAAPWLALAQLALLLLSTCFVVIEVGEQGLHERCGKPVGSGLLNPGLHLKWPWPVDRVYRQQTDQIQTFTIGLPETGEEGEEGHDQDHAHKGEVLLWTESHAKEEFLLLVASRESAAASTNAAGDRKNPPVNCIGANIPVQFRIADLRAWAYHHTNPAQLLGHIGTRALVRYLAGADFIEVLSRGRFAASDRLREQIQAEADRLKLGVKILCVGLQDMHPPVAVARDFEEVGSAEQKRQAAILSAQAQRTQTNALAAAEAFRRAREAEAEARRVEVGALARGARFTNQLAAYQAAPAVYTQRAYLETLVRAGAGVRKYILASTNTQDVIQYNLEEKIRADLLDLSVPKAP